MDTSIDIFKTLYKVSVLSIALMDEMDIELFGTPIVKGMSLEDNINRDRTVCYLTINKLLELYRKGYEINIPENETTVAIYESINKHLCAWDLHLSTSVNKKIPPTKDLLDLNDMANMLFDTVKHKYVKEEVEHYLGGINYDHVGMDIIPKKVVKINDIHRKDLSKQFKRKSGIKPMNMSILNK